MWVPEVKDTPRNGVLAYKKVNGSFSIHKVCGYLYGATEAQEMPAKRWDVQDAIFRLGIITTGA